MHRSTQQAEAQHAGFFEDNCQSRLYDAYELQELEQCLNRQLDFRSDPNVRSFSMPRWYEQGAAAHQRVQKQGSALQGPADQERSAAPSTAKAHMTRSRAKRSRWPLVNFFLHSVKKKQNNMLITKEDAMLPSTFMSGSVQPWSKELNHHHSVVHHHHVHHHHHHHILAEVRFEEIDWPLSPARLQELDWIMSKNRPKSENL